MNVARSRCVCEATLLYELFLSTIKSGAKCSMADHEETRREARGGERWSSCDAGDARLCPYDPCTARKGVREGVGKRRGSGHCWSSKKFITVKSEVQVVVSASRFFFPTTGKKKKKKKKASAKLSLLRNYHNKQSSRQF